MGKSKKDSEYEKVAEIVARFKDLSTKELIERRDLFGGSLPGPFKIAINLLLKQRGIKD
jgi:hypothetical protein